MIARYADEGGETAFAHWRGSDWEPLPLPEDGIPSSSSPRGTKPAMTVRGLPRPIVALADGDWDVVGKVPKEFSPDFLIRGDRLLLTEGGATVLARPRDFETHSLHVLWQDGPGGSFREPVAITPELRDEIPRCSARLRRDGSGFVLCTTSSGDGQRLDAYHIPARRGDVSRQHLGDQGGRPSQPHHCARGESSWLMWSGDSEDWFFSSTDGGEHWQSHGRVEGRRGEIHCVSETLLWFSGLAAVVCSHAEGCREPRRISHQHAFLDAETGLLAVPYDMGGGAVDRDQLAIIFTITEHGAIQPQELATLEEGPGLMNVRRLREHLLRRIP